MKFSFWRSRRVPAHYIPQSRVRTPEMMYRAAGSHITETAGLPELLDTFVAGFEGQLAVEITRLARVAGQTFVSEPSRLVFRGPSRTRTWQRAWKIVSTHEVILRASVEMDESEPGVVRASVNSSVVAESVLGSSGPESSAHLSARVSYFRDRLLAHARLAMGGRELVAKRRADLVGHHLPAPELAVHEPAAEDGIVPL